MGFTVGSLGDLLCTGHDAGIQSGSHGPFLHEKFDGEDRICVLSFIHLFFHSFPFKTTCKIHLVKVYIFQISQYFPFSVAVICKNLLTSFSEHVK